MNGKILIIPDVHGRTFWKKALDTGEYEKVIFLGDYVDPYEFEGITSEMALDNFKSIIAYKQQNTDKVVLLLGNHDLHYFSEYYYELAGGSRYNPFLAMTLHRLFWDNRQLFQLAWETELGDKHYLFSHAGITQTWLSENVEQIGKPDAWHLNRLIQTNEGLEALAQVGRLRGGYYESGSMVWADVDELAMSDPLPNCYQVVGHTMQLDSPIITDKFACLDCRMAFSLDDTGQFSPVTEKHG